MPLENKTDQIRQAIGAHGAWKLKLRTAANTGRADFSPDDIARDDQCAFGQWLRQIEPQAASDPHYAAIRERHRRFHQAAGQVAVLIKDGQKDAALAALGDGSAFTMESTQLTNALTDWKRDA